MDEPFPVYDFDPRNLPDRLLKAIGLTVASAAQTEHIVQQAIAGCAGLNVEYGLAFTTHMNMPLRFSVLRSLAEIRFEPSVIDLLDTLINDIDTAFQKRNEVAHDSWGRDPKTETISASMRRHELASRCS
jgi:hypothetical protein